MTIDTTYSLLKSTHELIKQWLAEPQFQIIPRAIRQVLENRVQIHGQDSPLPLLPTPFMEVEAITAFKALEAAYALALADIKYGASSHVAEIDVNHAAGFLFLAFLSSIDGLTKQDPNHYGRLFDTDLLQSQSNVYRLSVTNMFKTKNGYYHFHGGLNASKSLEVLKLPSHCPELNDYDMSCRSIEEKTKEFTNEQIDEFVTHAKQAGSPVYSRQEYLATEHGKIESRQPWMKLNTVESKSAPFSLNQLPSKHTLSGIKVLDLTRVIAGPLIGRTIAEYGADVLRVHNINLPDVPYYQVDLNYGKRACHIDLKSEQGKQQFTALLMDVDVIIDGYRPGVLERLGFGVKDVAKLLSKRDRGFVYLSENCHGWTGPLCDRSGWQQIADASTGMSKEQGRFWLKDDEPIAPPFPMADFGTGEMGAIAILHGLYLRSTVGGSYHAKVSLCAFNNMVMNSGKYSNSIQDALRNRFLPLFNKIGITHSSNFNKVGTVALEVMRKHSPQLWTDSFMTSSTSKCFGPSPSVQSRIKTQKGVVKCVGKTQTFCRTTRYNGFDEPGWEHFEQDTFSE